MKNFKVISFLLTLIMLLEVLLPDLATIVYATEELLDTTSVESEEVNISETEEQRCN